MCNVQSAKTSTKMSKPFNKSIEAFKKANPSLSKKIAQEEAIKQWVKVKELNSQTAID